MSPGWRPGSPVGSRTASTHRPVDKGIRRDQNDCEAARAKDGTSHDGLGAPEPGLLMLSGDGTRGVRVPGRRREMPPGPSRRARGCPGDVHWDAHVGYLGSWCGADRACRGWAVRAWRRSCPGEHESHVRCDRGRDLSVPARSGIQTAHVNDQSSWAGMRCPPGVSRSKVLRRGPRSDRGTDERSRIGGAQPISRYTSYPEFQPRSATSARR